jgi:hypothetical protein
MSSNTDAGGTPDLRAEVARLKAELSETREIVVRLDDVVGGLIKILENAEVTAEPGWGGKDHSAEGEASFVEGLEEPPE